VSRQKGQIDRLSRDLRVRRMAILRASLPYLKTCPWQAFRVELIVQAFDGATERQRAEAIVAASVELQREASA